MGCGLDGNAQCFQAAQVISGSKHGVDVGVQVRFEERRQKRGKQFSGEQNGAAAARSIRFENGGGFALNGSVVGDFDGVDRLLIEKRRRVVFVECFAPLPR